MKALRSTVRLLRTGEAERGDVPGWVMVTVMTAGLVALLWGTVGGALRGLFEGAIAKVSGF